MPSAAVLSSIAPGIPQLIELLENSDPAVRNSATRRFGKSAENLSSREAMEPGIPTIIKLLGDWESCQSAAEVFCRELAAHRKENPIFHEAIKPGIPDIIKLLEDSVWTVRRSCANAFGELAAHHPFHETMRPGIPNIIKLLDNSHWEVLQASADTFGELAAHPVFHGAMKLGIPEIIKLLENGNWEVRGSSANAFSELAAHPIFREALKAGIPQIIKLLGDWQLFAAVFHEAIMGGISQIIKMLDNRHWEVRRAAAYAFSGMAAHPVFHETLKPDIPLIIKLLDDSKVGGPAANAFCKLATHPVFHETMKLGISQIIKLLGNWMVRQSAAEVFRKLAAYSVFHEDMKPGIPHIIKLLYSRDLEVRQSTANVFGELAAHRVFHHAMIPGIPRMKELLADSSISMLLCNYPHVRFPLQKLGPQAIGPKKTVAQSKVPMPDRIIVVGALCPEERPEVGDEGHTRFDFDPQFVGEQLEPTKGRAKVASFGICAFGHIAGMTRVIGIIATLGLAEIPYILGTPSGFKNLKVTAGSNIRALLHAHSGTMEPQAWKILSAPASTRTINHTVIHTSASAVFTGFPEVLPPETRTVKKIP
ncbi:armadillo-type protein [Mycena leptocephala]|nr:armadillo-type protein [Mycena leptocephala]